MQVHMNEKYLHVFCWYCSCTVYSQSGHGPWIVQNCCQVARLPSGFPTDFCVHLSSLPYMPHASPVSLSLVRSPECHFLLGTGQEAPAYYAAGTLQSLAGSFLLLVCATNQFRHSEHI